MTMFMIRLDGDELREKGTFSQVSLQKLFSHELFHWAKKSRRSVSSDITFVFQIEIDITWFIIYNSPKGHRLENGRIDLHDMKRKRNDDDSRNTNRIGQNSENSITIPKKRNT